MRCSSQWMTSFCAWQLRGCRAANSSVCAVQGAGCRGGAWGYEVQTTCTCRPCHCGVPFPACVPRRAGTGAGQGGNRGETSAPQAPGATATAFQLAMKHNCTCMGWDYSACTACRRQQPCSNSSDRPSGRTASLPERVRPDHPSSDPSKHNVNVLSHVSRPIPPHPPCRTPLPYRLVQVVPVLGVPLLAHHRHVPRAVLVQQVVPLHVRAVGPQRLLNPVRYDSTAARQARRLSNSTSVTKVAGG